MKVKLLTLLAALFLVCNISSAQGVGTFKAKKKTAVVKKNIAPQRQGTFIMPKVGAGYNFGVGGFAFNLQAVFGYEYNNHFALGVGTGFNNISFNFSYMQRTLSVSIPLYLNIHGDFSKHKTTAYYSLDLGVQMPIRRALENEHYYWGYYYDSYDDDYYYDYGYHDNPLTNEYFCKGFFVSPEIGIRFNSCYLGLNFTYARRHEYVYKYDNRSHIHYTNNLQTLSLKFGYKIPLNLKR